MRKRLGIFPFRPNARDGQDTHRMAHHFVTSGFLCSFQAESASRRVAEDFAHAWDMEGPCVDLRVCWSHVLLV